MNRGEKSSVGDRPSSSPVRSSAFHGMTSNDRHGNKPVAKPRFHPKAAAEFTSPIAWYKQRSHRAADRFEDEVEQALQRIGDNPQLYPRYDEVHRFAVVKRFPYSVVYRMLGDQQYVVAAAHSSRAPGYWRGRVD